MSIGVYVRVSHTSQDLAAQEGELERWVRGQGDESVEWFRDKHTGTRMDRPGFDRLMGEVRAGRITTIVVWRLDRLGRTAAGLAVLFEELRARKVNLISLRDGLNLDTPTGRLVAGILASVAEYENEVRKERQTIGIARAKAEGKRFGPEPGKYKGRRVKVTPEQEVIVKRLRSEGEGVSAIARATGLSRPTIYDILGSVVRSAES